MARTASLRTHPPALTPIEPQTFAREADRERLSEVAIKAFLNLAKAWGLSNAESAGLLGVSASSLDRIKRGYRPELSQDQLTRVSALVGDLQGPPSSLRRRHGGRVDSQGEPGRRVRPPDPDRGDDRGRHSEDARSPPVCRRRARRPLSLKECWTACRFIERHSPRPSGWFRPRAFAPRCWRRWSPPRTSRH